MLQDRIIEVIQELKLADYAVHKYYNMGYAPEDSRATMPWCTSRPSATTKTSSWIRASS